MTGSFTEDELRRLFAEGDGAAVCGDRIFTVLFKLAYVSGLRFGEILNLKGGAVRKDMIVADQPELWQVRQVPVPQAVAADLEWLKSAHGSGFLFSADGGITALSQDTVSKRLAGALVAIGISREEQRARRLTVHSFRRSHRQILDNWARDRSLDYRYMICKL
jgi:integrase